MAAPSDPVNVHVQDGANPSRRLAMGEFLPSTGHLHVTKLGYHVAELSLDASVVLVYADRGPTFPALGTYVIDRGKGDSFFLRFLHDFED